MSQPMTARKETVATTVHSRMTLRLSIGLLSSDAALREKIESILDLHAAGKVSTYESTVLALSEWVDEAPDCLVVAYEALDAESGKDIVSICSSVRQVPTVLVCREVTGGQVRRLLDRGVDGIILSDDLEAALTPAIAAACAGQVSVPGHSRFDLQPPVLTTRERQILRLVVDGMTNAQIAATLFLAESTVKSHLSSSFAKLRVSSRHEAVSLLMDPERRRGLDLKVGRSPSVSK